MITYTENDLTKDVLVLWFLEIFHILFLNDVP